MATRKNTNPRALDIAPQLQDTLNANGMQAQIAMTPTGEYQLVTMAHNTSTPRRYTLNDAQLEALRNGGTNVWDKKAYQTFVSIVRNDYYIPGSWGAARNANSPVNMGLMGIDLILENMDIEENVHSTLLKVQDTDVLIVSWMDSEHLEDMVIMQEE